MQLLSWDHWDCLENKVQNGTVLEVLKEDSLPPFTCQCCLLHLSAHVVIVNRFLHGGVRFSFSIPWQKTLAAVRCWWEAHTVLCALTLGVGLVSHFQPGATVLLTIHNSGALGIL